MACKSLNNSVKLFLNKIINGVDVNTHYIGYSTYTSICKCNTYVYHDHKTIINITKHNNTIVLHLVDLNEFELFDALLRQMDDKYDIDNKIKSVNDFVKTFITNQFGIYEFGNLNIIFGEDRC